MKKKQFAVKLWLELGDSYVTIVEAFNKQEAYALAQHKSVNKYGKDNSTIVSCRIKEIPTCVIRSAFGRIPIKVCPNPYYDNEIIINGERVNLPDEFRYWDIKSIVIHNAGLPVIATVTTDKHTFVVQNNVIGCNKCFEIMK